MLSEKDRKQSDFVQADLLVAEGSVYLAQGQLEAQEMISVPSPKSSCFVSFARPQKRSC